MPGVAPYLPAPRMPALAPPRVKCPGALAASMRRHMHGCFREVAKSKWGLLCKEGVSLSCVCLPLHFLPNVTAWASCAPDQASIHATAWGCMCVYRGDITLQSCNKKGVLASWPAGCGDGCTHAPSSGHAWPNPDTCMGQWCHACLKRQWSATLCSIITYMGAGNGAARVGNQAWLV